MRKVHLSRVTRSAASLGVAKPLPSPAGGAALAIRGIAAAGLLVLLAAGACAPVVNSSSPEADAIPAIDEIFSDVDQPGSPGCALGVIRDGEFVYRRAYGLASLEHDVSITSETLFYAGSVSKQFVAASIALAAEQDRLSLDDEVRKHIPELPDYGHKITVRNLIHHTSGIRDYLVLLLLAGKPAEDVLEEEGVLGLIARQKALNFDPGSQYLYSNSGYFLLSEILHRATGMTLRQFAEKNIFEPLGMTHTRFHDDRREVVPNRAFAYAPGEDGFTVDWATNFDQVGSGGLLTSVNDMLAWERNFLEPRIGSKKFLETIHTPGEQPVGGSFPDARYAFGMFLGRYRGLKTVGHAGAMFGYRAAYLRVPEERFAAICLCNVSNADPMDRMLKITDYFLADRLGPKDPEQQPDQTPSDANSQPAVRVSAATLARFAGIYHSEELDASYRFRAEEGKLVFAGHKTLPEMPLEPTGENQFRTPREGLDLEFMFGPNSVVLDAFRVTGIRFDRED